MTNDQCCSHDFTIGPKTHTYNDVFNLSIALIPQVNRTKILTYDAKLEWVYANDWVAQLYDALYAENLTEFLNEMKFTTTVRTKVTSIVDYFKQDEENEGTKRLDFWFLLFDKQCRQFTYLDTEAGIIFSFTNCIYAYDVLLENNLVDPVDPSPEEKIY